jgi:hypothetical protein
LIIAQAQQTLLRAGHGAMRRLLYLRAAITSLKVAALRVVNTALIAHL